MPRNFADLDAGAANAVDGRQADLSVLVRRNVDAEHYDAMFVLDDDCDQPWRCL